MLLLGLGMKSVGRVHAILPLRNTIHLQLNYHWHNIYSI